MDTLTLAGLTGITTLVLGFVLGRWSLKSRYGSGGARIPVRGTLVQFPGWAIAEIQALFSPEALSLVTLVARMRQLGEEPGQANLDAAAAAWEHTAYHWLTATAAGQRWGKRHVPHLL